MISVEITNYQSIGHTKIDIEGFTTMTGRNALGKSAVLRAINAALTNQQGTDFIKWGESFCEVRIKDKDLDLLWHKEEGNNFYEINGTVYKKIGKEEPPSPVQAAGYKVLVVGDEKINLNYASQFNPLFLLDRRDSKSADLLTSVYGLDRLYKAIELCNRDQKQNSDELKFRDKDLELVSQDLERFKDFEDIEREVSSIKSEKRSLDSLSEEIEKIKIWHATISAIVHECRKYKAVEETDIPDSRHMEKDFTELNQLYGFHTKSEALSKELPRLYEVDHVNIPEEKVVMDKVEEFVKLHSKYLLYDMLTSQTESLQSVETVSIPETAISVSELDSLKKYDSDLEILKTEAVSLKRSLDEAVKEEQGIKDQIAQFENCPYCGHALEK